jgi:hypothetical protein
MGKGDTVKVALMRWSHRETAMEPVMDGAAGVCGRLAPRLGPFAFFPIYVAILHVDRRDRRLMRVASHFG